MHAPTGDDSEFTIVLQEKMITLRWWGLPPMAIFSTAWGRFSPRICGYSSSGCWPSWAFQAHSVTLMSVNDAVKEDSSGEHA